MNIKKSSVTFVLAIAALGFSANSEAFFISIDPPEIAKTTLMYRQLLQQYTTLKNQYQTMQNQYGQMKEQYKSITGNYGWGSFQNSASDLTNDKEWAASDWKSSLKGMAGGNKQRYQQLLAQYKQNHSSMSTSSYAKGTNKALAITYQNQVATNQASSTISTDEFDQINQHLKTLYQLGQQIENAKKNNDLKSAVDLNSRIELEVGFISTEELRMSTVLNQQMAQAQAANIANENEASTYNQAGENPQ